MDYGQKCSDIAKKAEGLSGREISKLGVAWQVSADVMVITNIRMAAPSHSMVCYTLGMCICSRRWCVN